MQIKLQENGCFHGAVVIGRDLMKSQFGIQMQGTLQKRQGIQQHGIVAHFSGVVNEFFHQMLRDTLTAKGVFHIKPFQLTFRIREGM